jgi:hypothetical protein
MNAAAALGSCLSTTFSMIALLMFTNSSVMLMMECKRAASLSCI